MTTTARFRVAYRPGRVRSWVVLYTTAAGSTVTAGRYLTKVEAEEAIATLAAALRQEA